ncbi:hypothetical protein QBC38DRAFT_462308 [Podospora fimiseda]|uniref:6-methylsalicylate decarboxylase n=1 Tax=Podospora fimiseda TaxID=252190 RepID=A0AAN6YLG4_9PEZI|nr:hypothetical protein QBC38DRAFT_462308 [Podospora fimiseda]
MHFLTLSPLLSVAAATKHRNDGLIDTHLHALTPSFVAAIEAGGGDSSGLLFPNWSPDLAFASLDSSGASLGILSVSAPGVTIAGVGQEARSLARSINNELGQYSTNPKFQHRLGYFGTLPDWRDVNGTLAELDFLFAEQKLCSGVIIFSSYGVLLSGDRTFRPIWQKLQQYKALVLLHPTLFNVTPPRAGGLPPYFIDFPLATTRAATDLVFNGILRDYPDVDIILSHAGGTLPYLAFRVEGAMLSPAAKNVTDLTLGQVKEYFARFYHDTALSTGNAQLNGLLDFTDPSRILFGTDHPYPSQETLDTGLQSYHRFVATNPRGKKLAPKVLRKNAIDLLNKHALNPKKLLQ